MNAGCFGSEISNIFLSANGVDYFGNIIKIAKEDFNFEYRYNPLALNSIFTEIILSAEKDDQKSISSKIEKINIERTLSQPKGIKTGGSTFKNPDVTISKKKAWELIRETKNHELSFDGVSFSKKHSNFIENKQNKSANIIEDFCKLVKKNIFEKIDTKILNVTQGFIASNENSFNTTLGREGSDYSAAIYAYCLNAESVTIWKDVPGVLNADPRVFKKTQLYIVTIL